MGIVGLDSDKFHDGSMFGDRRRRVWAGSTLGLRKEIVGTTLLKVTV